MAETADPPELFLEDVGRSHGGRLVLAGLNLTASAGEFVMILGANGAGKTTLVHLLSGLYPPTRGRIEVLGHDMSRDATAALARLGVVFQDQTLDLDLSLKENLKFHARLHGLPRREAAMRIAEVLDRFGLTERADEPARVLSGGNRRRLELARALLHRPRVLLLDEATVGLDPGSRQALLEHVCDLCRQEGLLALWTTHLLDEVDAADRIVCLHEGHLVFDGTPREARERMATAPAAGALHALLDGHGPAAG